MKKYAVTGLKKYLKKMFIIYRFFNVTKHLTFDYLVNINLILYIDIKNFIIWEKPAHKFKLSTKLGLNLQHPLYFQISCSPLINLY